MTASAIIATSLAKGDKLAAPRRCGKLLCDEKWTNMALAAMMRAATNMSSPSIIPPIHLPDDVNDCMTDTLTLTRPDDWHIHLRDGASLPRTVGDAAAQFGRAMVMPNLVPPVSSATDAAAYRQRILDARPPASDFEPMMVLYLTDQTTAADIAEAAAQPWLCAAKLYPAGATTHSDAGVTAIDKIYPTLEAMQKHGLVLAVHGEETDHSIDIFDREQAFIDQTLSRIVRDFPALRIVFEHISTQQAVAFVDAASDNIGATITAHHMLYNRNDMLVGGIKPHYYCLPVLKRGSHQQALINAATSGNSKFFLGTDSAPHLRGDKESHCGCAGCYTAHAALELYAEIFDRAGALAQLEAFSSFHGADFYGLPRNRGRITLQRQPWTAPRELAMASDTLVPLCAGETLQWRRIDG